MPTQQGVVVGVVVGTIVGAVIAAVMMARHLRPQAGPRPVHVHVFVFWKVNLIYKVGVVEFVVVKVEEARGGSPPPAEPATETAFHRRGVANGLTDPVDYMCLLDGPVAGRAAAAAAAVATAAITTARRAPAVAGGHGATALGTTATCFGHS